MDRFTLLVNHINMIRLVKFFQTMIRLEQLKKKVDELYLAKNESRADWADWLYAHHVFVVAGYGGELANRFGANKELSMAAGMLHDIADAVMKRENPEHEEKSMEIARGLLRDAGFNDEEIKIVVDDAIRLHGCHNGITPRTFEGKVMATADALAHLKTDFYDHAVKTFRAQKESAEDIKQWIFSKLERDFNAKILFDEIKEEAKPDYERLKSFFSGEFEELK